MALLTLQEAASRIDASVDVLEEWIRVGLLKVVRSERAPPGLSSLHFVDAEQLTEVAETEGWHHLSAGAWDDED